MSILAAAGAVGTVLLSLTLGEVIWTVLRPRIANRWICAIAGVAIGWSVIGVVWALVVVAVSL